MKQIYKNKIWRNTKEFYVGKHKHEELLFEAFSIMLRYWASLRGKQTNPRMTLRYMIVNAFFF